MRTLVATAAVFLTATSCTAADETPPTRPASSSGQAEDVTIQLEKSEVQSLAVVGLEIRFPSLNSHTWGLESTVEREGDGGEWDPLFYVITDPTADRPAPYYRTGRENTAIPSIGFSSDRNPIRLEIRIPPLKEGGYRFCKSFSANATVDEATYRTQRVCDEFEVDEGNASVTVSPAPTPTWWPLRQAKSRQAPLGKAQRFRLPTHCGINWSVDFDGSFWETDDSPAIWNPSQGGTMTLVAEDEAVFETPKGVVVRFSRAGDTRRIPPCF